MLLKKIALIALISIPLFAVADDKANEKLVFKNKIENLLKINLSKKDVLLVNTPELYIWNLKTTDFLKGLMFETSLVLDFMAKNSNDTEKLRDFNKEFQQNSTCLSIIIGNSGNHFMNIYNLTLKEPSEKEAYLKSYNFLANQIKPYELSESYINLCKEERLKVIEYSKNN